MSEEQIIQIWNDVNQKLQLDCGEFDMLFLCSRRWYLQILQLIYPFFNEKLIKIAQIQSEEAAIDRMLLLLTQQQIIDDDFLQIKGTDITNGNIDTIFYLVQLFKALVDKQLEEMEDGEEQNEENNQQEQEQEQHPNKKSEESQQNNFSERQQQVRSVQGIKHEFDKSSQQNEDQYRQAYNFPKQLNQRQIAPKQIEDNSSDFNPHDMNKQTNETNQNKKTKMNKQDNKKVIKISKKQKQVKIHKLNEQQEDDNYLKQKLIKHKSDKDLHVKKLITNPKIKKEYPKIKTIEEKKLTNQIKNMLVKNQKKVKEKQSQGNNHLIHKRNELQYYLRKKDRKYRNQNNQKIKIDHLLKFKEHQLRKENEEIKKNMEYNVERKKENYIRTINKLIINLEKNRIVEQQREERQRIERQREYANKRLQAIEEEYRIQRQLLKEKSQDKLNRKGLAHTDHRVLIEALEKELKKQNERQLMNLKMKFRRQQAQLEDDLQKLQQQIINAYKRN